MAYGQQPLAQAEREAAWRVVATNNLHMIGVAMLVYHDAHRSYPARANFNREGKPLLSWRVHLLPYLEQKDLYRQFRLDQTWDSEHNRRLVARMPDVYRSSISPASSGKTAYLGVCGDGLMFHGNTGRCMADVRDGTSYTIAVVEVDDDQSVPWTKLDDWQFDAQRPLAKLGKARPGGFLALFANSSTRLIPPTVDPALFLKLLTISGGEDIRDRIPLYGPERW